MCARVELERFSSDARHSVLTPISPRVTLEHWFHIFALDVGTQMTFRHRAPFCPFSLHVSVYQIRYLPLEFNADQWLDNWLEVMSLWGRGLCLSAVKVVDEFPGFRNSWRRITNWQRASNCFGLLLLSTVATCIGLRSLS
ncbi:hypothetical protein Nepgr_012410 [Nepenthes gracilis]|uniref:Uncharacterized protein n=1 Tax=Nepenthes gracilis TaxID=150966 RepID=A0AAD3SH62_NEPGR|nr:hypothetical protein Nepgr_012410 [Nepenthes gracilis]